MSTDHVPARPASTVLVIRCNPDLEVLMVQRPDRGFFGGLLVFPGGAVEECDSKVQGEHSDMEHRVAGLRETAEEVGFVLTSTGFVPAPTLRGAELLEELDRQGIGLGVDQMAPVSRWVTPSSAPERFDTRFYLFPIEGDPDVVVDTDELEGHMWVTPDEALGYHARGELSMVLPTLSHLRWLRRRSDIQDAISAAAGTDGMTIVESITVGGVMLARYRGAT